MIIPFHIFPTILLQWWGSDSAVQSQRYLPLSHRPLTSPPFHCNPLILCRSMPQWHRHRITEPLQCYLNLTVQLSAHFILMVWLRTFCGDIANFTARLQASCNEKICIVAARVFKFENPCIAWRQDCEYGGESTDDDGGTATTCEFVNVCSSQLIVVAPSSSVKGA